MCYWCNVFGPAHPALTAAIGIPADAWVAGSSLDRLLLDDHHSPFHPDFDATKRADLTALLGVPIVAKADRMSRLEAALETLRTYRDSCPMVPGEAQPNPNEAWTEKSWKEVEEAGMVEVRGETPYRLRYLVRPTNAGC